MRTLAVYCDGFPAVAAGKGTDVPVAVMHANRMLSVNPAARLEGVQPGMLRRQAQAHCPDLDVMVPDESRDMRANEQIMAVLHEVSPRWEVTEPGRFAVPVRGPSRHFGGDRATAARLLGAVVSALEGLGPVRGSEGAVRGSEGAVANSAASTIGPPVGVAVADGPRAAAILAEEAAIGSLTGSPDGAVVIVAPGATAAHLARMPTKLLLCGGASLAPREEVAQLVDVLERLGLGTLGRFARLERTDVLARFGHCGLLAHNLARGVESSPVPLEYLPVELGVSARFDPPAESVDQVGFMAKTLAAELYSGLGSRGLTCTRVLVVAETELGERIERFWRDEGTLDAPAVAQRARWQLDGWLSSGHTTGRQRGGVISLELLVDQAVPDDGRQLGLWDRDDGIPERTQRGVARLIAMLGPDSVVVPRFRGGRSPRERYHLVPIESIGMEDLPDGATHHVAETRNAEGGGDAPWPGVIPAPSPVLVWPDPPVVGLFDEQGHTVGVNGRGLLSSEPTDCVFGNEGASGNECASGSGVAGSGTPTAVHSWAGPWCIEEKWWDPTGHRRRARLQILVDSGAHLITLESGQWRLEATYD